MSTKHVGPAVTARVIGLSHKHFGTSAEAREAIRKAIDAIPDHQLLHVQGVHVFLMA